MSIERFLSAATCTAAMLLFAGPAAAAPEIQQWTTDNGAHVMFVSAPEIPMVDARVTFAAGSSRDGDHPGIARMTSSLLMSGTDGLDADALAQAFESEGAEVSTGSARDMAWVELRSLAESEHLADVAETAAAMMARPAMPAAEIARVRAQQRADIENEAQSPSDIASDRFWSRIYGDHPYAHDPLGTPASLEEALMALADDYEFLLEGDVFTEDVVEGWINYKMENEVDPLRLRPHPHEFFLYYDN